MKSNSNVRPAAIQPLGNGAYHYNYNVQERTADPEPVAQSEEDNDGQETAVNEVSPRVVYDYDTVEVWGVPNYKDLTRAVIRAYVSETEEFGLINDYNAAHAGLLDDEEAEKAEAAYTAHLQRVAQIKAMVKEDIAGSGY